MEVGNLTKFILIVVISGMLLGVGLISFDKFGDAIKVSSITTNETITVASNTATTAYDEVTDITSFQNSTQEVIADLTNNDSSLNWTEETGVILLDNNFPDGTYLVSYVWDADSVGSDSMTDMLNATSPIGSTWIPLIITIMALAIVLGLVIRSFGRRSR